MVNLNSLPIESTTTNWRQCPGYLNPGYSDFESVHILIGRFLADRHSEDPLSDAPLLTENAKFEWGESRPVEKVIYTQDDLEFLMKHPPLFRNAISLIEPWEHVGHNPLGEEVWASLNVAYIAQKIADCDSILFPLWSSGLLDPDVVVPLITSGLAVIVEGGDPSVRDASTFEGAKCSLDDLHRLVEKLLLSRSPANHPSYGLANVISLQPSRNSYWFVDQVVKLSGVPAFLKFCYFQNLIASISKALQSLIDFVSILYRDYKLALDRQRLSHVSIITHPEDCRRLKPLLCVPLRSKDTEFPATEVLT